MPRGEGVLREGFDDTDELSMHLFEECARLSNGAGVLRVRFWKEIRSFERKRAAFLAREASPHDVLPVRGVKEEVVDGVTAGAGSEERFGGREAADRTEEVRTVPGTAVERAAKRCEEMLTRIHTTLSCVKDEEPALLPF